MLSTSTVVRCSRNNGGRAKLFLVAGREMKLLFGGRKKSHTFLQKQKETSKRCVNNACVNLHYYLRPHLRPQREHARLRAPDQLEAAVGAPLGVRPLRVSIPVPPRFEAPQVISPGLEAPSREKYVFEGDRRP